MSHMLMMAGQKLSVNVCTRLAVKASCVSVCDNMYVHLLCPTHTCTHTNQASKNTLLATCFCKNRIHASKDVQITRKLM